MTIGCATRTAILGTPDYPGTESSPQPQPARAEPAEDEWADADPAVAARALLELVAMPNPPLRKIIGPGAQQMVAMALDQRRRDYATDPEFCWPT